MPGCSSKRGILVILTLPQAKVYNQKKRFLTSGYGCQQFLQPQMKLEYLGFLVSNALKTNVCLFVQFSTSQIIECLNRFLMESVGPAFRTATQHLTVILTRIISYRHFLFTRSPLRFGRLLPFCPQCFGLFIINFSSDCLLQRSYNSVTSELFQNSN